MTDDHDKRDEPPRTDGEPETSDERDERDGTQDDLDEEAGGDGTDDDGDDDEGELGVDPTASAHEEIDPELLALGESRPAKPRWTRPLVMVAVLVVIGIMLVWFRAELLYFFAPAEPVDLGEAHDAQLGPEVENRFVRFEGMPLAPRNLSPSQRCGQVQGFPTYQRRFLCRGHQSAIPLMGRPEHDLVVQRYLRRQIRIDFTVPEERREEALDQAQLALGRVSSLHNLRRARPDEIGQFVAEVQGQTGRTDMGAVMDSVRFQLEAAVPGVRSISVERVQRDAPGSFVGRVVRRDHLGSRFAAVADYFQECTDFDLADEAYVVLDGSEVGDDLLGMDALCYGQAPGQYWPYLALYVILVSLFVLNAVLLVRFFLSLRRR